MVRAAEAMWAAVLAGVLLETAGAGRAAVAGRAGVADLAAAVQVVVAGGAVEAVARFRRTRLTQRANSNLDAATFNEFSLLLVA